MSIKMNNNRNIGRSTRVEVMLNNVVDKDVQAMLLPLNLAQNMMLCPKYSIRNNCITPNSFICNFVSLFGTMLFISSFVYRVYKLYFDTDILGYSSFMYIISYYDCSFYCIGFAMKFFASLFQRKINITFVLTIQKVHRFLSNTIGFRSYVIWNWISIISALAFYSIVFTYFAILLKIPYYTVFCSCILVGFDLSVVYASRLIKLLEDKIILWNVKVLKNETEESDDGLLMRRMFQAYVDILGCYDIYKVCYQNIMLYYTIEIFIHSLVHIQVALETFKGGKLDPSILTSLSVYVWIIKDLTLQIILNQHCEKFYIAIQNVQESCSLIMNSYCSDEKKKLCKNIQRLHRASFSKISACGLFYVDAALTLNLMGHLTNYIVVLLQFAFL